ncbi:MAG: SHOCT domain-containing protein [Clostridia bacterium]|nr:SHOCT domain-containing protein [Clostridia bacterium]
MQTVDAIPVAKEPAASAENDPIAVIERLAILRDKGIITEKEFSAKKTELLKKL